MGRSTFVMNLPEDLVAELNAKIRENNYINCIGIHEWLKAKGAPGSRASVHRYMQKLKDADGYNGKGGTYELAASIKGAVGHTRLETLFRKLGKIEYERERILKQIRDIANSQAALEEVSSAKSGAA